MIRDFEQDKRLGQYDLCVVGAGPAGITLALQMAAKGWRVALLEGGGREYSERSQAVYQSAQTSGMDIYPGSTRLRYLGGTSNHWAGRCRPFDPDDFVRSPLGGLPGWPIAFEEMDRYLAPAMHILDLPSTGFVAANPDLPGGRFPADASALSTPTRFGTKYADALQSSKNIDLFLNCNCLDLLYRSAGEKLAGIKVADFSGQTAVVQAGRYVLAMGALENARFLLNSDTLRASQLPAMNWVGRGFMEHLNVGLGSFMYAEGLSATGREYFAGEALASKFPTGKGNISMGILQEIKSYGRTAAVKSFLKNLACDMKLADKVQFIASFNCPGIGEFGTLLEQFPVENGSRVALTNERDTLGVRKIKVNWELSDADSQSIRSIAKEFAVEFARAGLGFVRLNDFILDEKKPIKASPHAHHMGTTRMAESARWGVVDKHCRVFGVNNLYVAGSSVFATGGGGNPTMPLLQLTLRLADHLLAKGKTA
jgi:choline dehydrogenase-like flavoprotein